MQSALFFPLASAGGLLRPAPYIVSDQTTLKAPISANQSHAASPVAQRPLLQLPEASSVQQPAARSSPSAVQPPAAAAPPQLSSAQQPIRPIRPLRTPDSIQWSPTRELLSEPQKSLQEVVKQGTQLASRQQVTSQQLLGAVCRALGPNTKTPFRTSRQFASALQAASASATQQRQPQSIQPQEQPEVVVQQDPEQQQQQQLRHQHLQQAKHLQWQQPPLQQQQEQQLPGHQQEVSVGCQHAARPGHHAIHDSQQQQKQPLPHAGQQQQQASQQHDCQAQTLMEPAVLSATAEQQWQQPQQLHMQWQGQRHEDLCQQPIVVQQ